MEKTEPAAVSCEQDMIGALRASNMFSSATSEELGALALSCLVETLPAGTVILQEGGSAEDLYLLLSGELLVYSHDDLGNELPLARFSEAYRFVGEQAFLALHRVRRSASVRTITASSLLRVAGTAFEGFLRQHQSVATKLIKLGSAQIREKVSQQMSLLRFLDVDSDSSAKINEQEFGNDALICTQGELGQNLYVVLSGTVRVYRTEPDGRVVHLARLQKGQSFGELSLLEGAPRLASVVAEGQVRVIAISGDAFQQAYQGNQQVRDHVATLRGIYSYGGEGIVLQFTAALFNRPALGTLFKLKDGRTLIANRVIGQDLWSIQLTELPAGVTQATYIGTTNETERTLLFDKSTLVGATVKGPWPGLSSLHQMLLDGASLSVTQIESFRRSGEIDIGLCALESEVFVCQCMRISSTTLRGAVDAGCRSVQALSARTGAGTVCGGCVPKLAALTNENLWREAQCVEVIDRTSRVKSFRFRSPQSDHAALAKPGQHLVIQANIEGTDVQRPYTLTSPVTINAYYEITVLRQASGLMSNWLFDNLQAGDAVKILPPGGTFLFDLADTRPLVCVVGGIGVTPALAMCRSAVAMSSIRPIHVDYAVAARDQAVCEDEWEMFTTKQPNITSFIRDTSTQGRIDAVAIGKLQNVFPDADWLICGSTPMQVAVQQLLREAKIPQQRMHIESFLAIGTTAPDASAVALLSPKQRSLLGRCMLVAAAFFILQALVGVKWPLPTWMQTTMFSIITGLGLVLLFVLEWKLGYVRLQDQKQDIARTYGIHIWLGPLIFSVLLLHSTQLGFALSFWLTVCFLASLVTGALLGINPRSKKWDKPRQYLLGSHITMSCIASGFAIAHGIMSVWY